MLFFAMVSISLVLWGREYVLLHESKLSGCRGINVDVISYYGVNMSCVLIRGLHIVCVEVNYQIVLAEL